MDSPTAKRGCAVASMSTTLAPLRARIEAVTDPARPEPRMMTSCTALPLVLSSFAPAVVFTAMEILLSVRLGIRANGWRGPPRTEATARYSGLDRRGGRRAPGWARGAGSGGVSSRVVRVVRGWCTDAPGGEVPAPGRSREVGTLATGHGGHKAISRRRAAGARQRQGVGSSKGSRKLGAGTRTSRLLVRGRLVRGVGRRALRPGAGCAGEAPGPGHGGAATESVTSGGGPRQRLPPTQFPCRGG